MAFGIGTNTQHTEHTIPKGQFQDVAVKCWFTSKGESRPLMLKLQTEQGEIIPVENIQVLKYFQDNILEDSHFFVIIQSDWREKYECSIRCGDVGCAGS